MNHSIRSIISGIDERADYLWLHCKDFDAARECWQYQAFCHSGDPFVYTSNGKIWLHGENDNLYTLDDMTIIPVINEEDTKSFGTMLLRGSTQFFGMPFGVCTDYPAIIGEYV